MKEPCIAAVLLMGLFTLTFAQGKPEDYLRAAQIKEAMEQDIFYAPKTFQWLNKKEFWYEQQTPEGKMFVRMNIDAKAKEQALDREKLAQVLGSKIGSPVDPRQLPLENLVIEEDRMRFQAFDQVWVIGIPSYACLSQSSIPAEIFERANKSVGPLRSPDGTYLAYIKNHNVYVKSLLDSTEYPLSFDGSPGEYYAEDLKWSPDSKKLASYQIRPNELHPVYLIESSPQDQLQPKLHTRNYLKPGDALPIYTPALFDVVNKKQVPVQGVSTDHQYALSDIVWRKDSHAYTFEYNQRGHQRYDVIEVDGKSGEMRSLVTELSKTFLDYRGKKFRYDLADGKEIIWASERDGWNQLYLYDGLTGKVKNQITKGPWVVRQVIHIDEQQRKILFAASGVDKGMDPYLIKYYQVNLDGSGLRCLTPEQANHMASFSEDFIYFVDTYSRMDLPPTAVLRGSQDGQVVMDLEKADIGKLLQTGWKMAEPFQAKGRDDSTDIWGIIVRPSHFDANKKYPVIEYIYGGPHSSFVPKSFISDPASGDYRPWTALHELAELGFVVVQIDGMGTSNRSKKFHDVCWKNLKDAGFPDRIRWIKAAAARYPYMDLSRVGIYGNSAGGQNSVAALLFHPEFYQVSVSSSGCHDNRMDKIGWNEQWMGYPVGPQYEASSNVTNAYRLKGKLLLILGEMDTNVPPESTLQLVNALIKANKNFDFLEIPGMGHSLGGDYGEHKRRDFFVKHLLKVDPPAWPEN